jgi:hypothetical protein
MQHGNYSVSVVVAGRNTDTFRPAFEYNHTDDKTYIEGRDGSKFKLNFKNHSAKRVLAVTSVDGLSVMNGQPAGQDKQGYIVPAFGTLEIDGWRLNDRETAAFVFGDKGESYGALSGAGTANSGVIGIMVYEEKVPEIHLRSIRPFNTSPMLGSRGLTKGIATKGGGTDWLEAEQTRGGNFDMGTGFGAKQDSSVRRVSFESKDDPSAMVVMYYASRKALEARGIKLIEAAVPTAQPNPFPAYTGCKPPAGWTGK